LLLLAVGCLLAAPVAASASIYTVDSTGDQSDEAVGSDGCETVVDSCTLRAAIEESNGSTGTKDTVVFAPSFDGQQADTIVLGSGLPPLTDSVHIDGDSGGQCKAGLGSMGPCAGVSGPIAGSAFTVEDDDVEIEGLSIAGVGGTAIDVINGSEDFEARDNWIGVKLDGGAGTNNKGVFLGPGSDNAMIGGTNAADRNVIAASDLEGLEIEGASSSQVQGNYFGVPPKGFGYIERNRENIEVADSTADGGSKAEDTEIGATIKGTALATAACDGGCNVISGATFAGIDLSGESDGDQAPASGPTTIHGNYIGMDSKGTAGVGAGHYAIDVRAASDVVIGGPHSGDTNYVTNCPFGIYQEGGSGFEARNNSIGLDITGTPADFSAAYEVGILASSLGLSKPPLVLENTVRMTKTGVGIDAPLGGAEIIDNVIQAGGEGIATGSFSEPSEGSLIEGNLIEGSWDGIQVSNGHNDVVGNGIFDSREVGIYVLNWGPVASATGNVIGGDLPVEENTISGTEGQAIRIVEELETDGGENEIARNNGAFNEALFIDLRGSANGEIQPPPFGAVTETGASGSGAEAGAKIRVFRKATAESGELESFLTETTADASGDWKVTFPASIPKGTVVAATQTSVAGGTSELAIAAVPDPIVIVDPVGEVGNGDSNGNIVTGCLFVGCGGLGAPAGSPPMQTRIVTGPKARTRATTVRFRFSSSRTGSSFECKLDRKPFEPCKSPQTYEKLKPGRHVFRVRTVDGGAADQTPARSKFWILR
jgi:hypothetical protein